jgi:tetratricopeptide (TPR) repeat protein
MMIGDTVSHYRIDGELGSGGMGIVYRAWDTKLARGVALKFLAPELTRDDEARLRFVQEARAAAALNHPNIVTIHEIDEAAGRTFIVMELVEGTNLRERIARGPVPAAEAEKITRGIAEGLAAAHGRGIVHRDVKPGNVLLTAEGRVKLVDFGLASLAGEARLTRTGTTLGTVAYMSPEQARGEEVDHRTDIWALGVIHYEMLTGRLPFRGDNLQARIYSILHAEPRPLEELAPDAAPAHGRIVARALAKDPAQRFQDAGAMARALRGASGAEVATTVLRARRRPFVQGRLARRWAAGMLVLLLAILVAVRFARRSGGPGDFRERDWLLITEFRDLTGDGGLEDALREALVIDMQQSRHVNVFAGRRLADALARMGRGVGEPLTAELGGELAQREGIPLLLAGSVSNLGGEYLVAAQLVDPTTGEALFARRVQATGARGLLPALDELSRAIRQRLGESRREIRSRDEPLAAVTTASLEALQQFSRGNRAFLASDWEAALAHLDQAVTTDTTFAMAIAKLARIHFYTANTRDALAFSERAYRLRDRLTTRERLYIEGEYHRYRAEYGEAIESLKALLADYPDDLEARSNLATTYIWTLQFPESLAEIERLPLGYRDTWYFHHTRGNARGGLADFEAAAADFRRALELGPTQPRSRMCLSWSLICAGDVEAGRAQLDTLAAGGGTGVVGTDYLLAKSLPVLGELARTLDHLAAARDDALARGNRNQAAWTHIYAGQCQLLRGATAAAVEEFRTAVEIWPGAYPLLHLGRTLAETGDLQGAVSVQRQLEALAEREATREAEQFLLKLAGGIALARRDSSLAVTVLEECLPYSFNLDAWYALGSLQLELGDLEAARRQFEFLLGKRFFLFHEGYPYLWPLSHYRLGLLEQAAGRPEEAAHHLRRFLELWATADPELTEPADARRRLDALAGAH